LDRKAQEITRILEHYRNQEGKGLWVTLASGFGLPVNSLPFEMLISAIPFEILVELRENLSALEALLFGHSGLLHTSGAKGS
jgi:hypothetical protein